MIKTVPFAIIKIAVLTLIILIPNLSMGQEEEKIKKDKSFFTIDNDSLGAKEYSTDEIRRELDEKEGLLKINTKAPKWSYSKNGNLTYSSEKLKDKIYVLDFWGSWCPPCIKAMPKMEKLHQHYKNQEDVVIIGVSARERKPDAAENYFTKMHFNYTHLPNGDKIADVFKVNSFPTVFIINQEGIIIDTFIGFQEKGDFERVKKVIAKKL